MATLVRSKDLTGWADHDCLWPEETNYSPVRSSGTIPSHVNRA